MLKSKTIALLGLLAFSLHPSAFLHEAALALEWEPVSGGRTAALPVSTNGQTGFVRLMPAQTGIAFTNRVSRQRYTTNQIYLNGSGVAAGDVDGDGWCDLFFAGLSGESRLYRNLGDWKFTDITKSAGLDLAGVDA